VAGFANLGFAARLPHGADPGDPFVHSGTAGYAAPEIFMKLTTKK